MPKRCYTNEQPPINEGCPYQVEELQGKDCLSDSLDYINNNFFVLDDASCQLTPEVYKHLKIKTEYVQPLSGTGRAELLPENATYWDTFVLNFSGQGVDVSENGVLKTITIPITGVHGIMAGRNVAISATGLTNDGDIKGPVKPLGLSAVGVGDILIKAVLPDSPRQVRTFFYTGPTPATNPGTKVKTEISLPASSIITNFVNNQLGIPAIDNQDPLFNGGDIYVIYQVNGLASYIAQSAATYSVTFGYNWYIKIIGNPQTGGWDSFSKSGSSNDDVSRRSVTNFIVYFLSREKGNSNYTLKRVTPLQNLSQLETTGAWLTPQNWTQY